MATRTKENVLNKACPKCHGDLYKQSYLGNEVEFTCLQCGLTLDTQQVARLLEQQAA